MTVVARALPIVKHSLRLIKNQLRVYGVAATGKGCRVIELRGCPFATYMCKTTDKIVKITIDQDNLGLSKNK